jgi:hypothetical protein
VASWGQQWGRGRYSVSSIAVDVRTELSEAPLRPYHWLLVGLVALATVFDG